MDVENPEFLDFVVADDIYFLHINDLRETKVLARRTRDLNDILMIDEIIEEVKKQDSSPE
ncbi:hypothetical protein GCM10028818_32570 [Spirosoma horti]